MDKIIYKNIKKDFSSILRMISYKESNYATHYIHRYPAKFLPHFPKIFIKNFLKDKDEIVLDPMCGSGTTLIESCLANKKCIGVEIDTIGYLISKVATTQLDTEFLSRLIDGIISNLKNFINDEECKRIDLPSEKDFPNYKLWFREEVLKEIILIRNYIYNLNVPEDIRNFLLLSLSSIIRTLSNADPRDIFPQRDKHNLIRKRKYPIQEFEKSLKKNLILVRDFTSRTNGNQLAKVIFGDSRKLAIADNSIDFIFTSPPYAYAMDYARINQLSSLLLSMKNEEFKLHRKKYVGTDRVSNNFFETNKPDYKGFEFAENEIKQAYDNNKKYGICLYKYFVDMLSITKEIYRVLKRNSYLVYIVGNSTINRTKFHTDRVFKNICENVGFNVEFILERPYYAYRLPRKRNSHSNIIKKDMFLVVKKL